MTIQQLVLKILQGTQQQFASICTIFLLQLIHVQKNCYETQDKFRFVCL